MDGFDVRHDHLHTDGHDDEYGKHRAPSWAGRRAPRNVKHSSVTWSIESLSSDAYFQAKVVGGG